MGSAQHQGVDYFRDGGTRLRSGRDKPLFQPMVGFRPFGAPAAQWPQEYLWTGPYLACPRKILLYVDSVVCLCYISAGFQLESTTSAGFFSYLAMA